MANGTADIGWSEYLQTSVRYVEVNSSKRWSRCKHPEETKMELIIGMNVSDNLVGVAFQTPNLIFNGCYNQFTK